MAAREGSYCMLGRDLHAGWKCGVTSVGEAAIGRQLGSSHDA
jgi:hypothetical protein